MTGPTGRNAILESVRQSLGRDRGPSSLPLPPTPAVDVGADVGAAFAAVLERVDGRVISVVDAAAAAREVERIAQARGATRVAFSNDPLLDGVRRSLQPDLFHEPADSAALLECEIGVTSAQAAIAETGTLVLDSNAERHRLLSLLPPVHVAIVPRDRLVATLGDAIDAAGTSPPPALTLITGPSRTADIELELVLGVHGPVELHVLLLDSIVADQ